MGDKIHKVDINKVLTHMKPVYQSEIHLSLLDFQFPHQNIDSNEPHCLADLKLQESHRKQGSSL